MIMRHLNETPGISNEKTAQPGVVWAERPRRLSLSKLDEKPGLAARSVRRPAPDRHLQYLVRADTLQRAFSRAGRVGEARRVGSGRFSAGVSRHVLGRDATPAHGNAV